jgi:hypothetical protein
VPLSVVGRGNDLGQSWQTSQHLHVA